MTTITSGIIKMQNYIIVFLTTVLVMVSTISQAQMTTGTSWNGGEISYPQGKPEVTSVHMVLDGSKKVALHCHPVPVFAYILRGILEVETGSGDKQKFTEGESLVEVMGTVHSGTVIDAPVEIVIFYAGAEGVPNTVLADSDEAGQYCING
jgi:quercetin dioxygenase-like cupin family protein